jgi:pyruvate formate lyase activating enzyme
MDTLLGLFEAASLNLKYVYMGNTPSETGQDTACSGCGKIVTKRYGYETRLQNLDKDGRCKACGKSVYRNFTFSSHVKH